MHSLLEKEISLRSNQIVFNFLFKLFYINYENNYSFMATGFNFSRVIISLSTTEIGFL